MIRLGKCAAARAVTWVSSLVQNFLANFNPLNSVMGELLNFDPLKFGHTDCRRPKVVLSWYRDNIYIIPIDVPDTLCATALAAVESLTKPICVPHIKWEAHGRVVTWGEGQVISEPSEFSMMCKGVL